MYEEDVIYNNLGEPTYYGLKEVHTEGCFLCCTAGLNCNTCKFDPANENKIEPDTEFVILLG